MQTLKFVVEVDVPNDADAMCVYRVIRDSIFNLGYNSAMVLPWDGTLAKVLKAHDTELGKKPVVRKKMKTFCKGR